MSYELEYNARSLPPADIARSFIPPEPHFVRLLSRSHTLVLGPRGSGKTTLLKMLTLRALQGWTHPSAEKYIRQIKFNAAFVPADVAWGKQIDALEKLNFTPLRKEAAFVVHTLRALIHAMREAIELHRERHSEYISHLAAAMSHVQEEQFVKLISTSLNIKPALNTLLGVEVALEERLDAINLGDDDNTFTVDSFRSKISLIISAFNGVVGESDRRWALLFDELEIAPTRIKSFLLSGIRSIDERLIVKLAIAPYMDDVGFEHTPTSPQPLHDYHTVQLTYPNKDDATQFSAELFLTTFHRLGIDITSLADAFQAPVGIKGFGRRSNNSSKRKSIPIEFRSLAKKDESFQRYATDRKLFDPGYQFTENNVAQDIRKVLPIVVARDYYLRFFKDGKYVADRSRKSYSLYAGYPSIVEITEGNPRAILTLVGPLVQAYKQSLGQDDKKLIPASLQSQAIRRVELLLTSLLQVIPLDIEGFKPGKGLLDFVDQVGRAFEDRLLRRPFTADYAGTFLLDNNVTPSVVSAVGKALNAGAIIHVPHPGGGPDSLLRGLKGQRFRLSYALAPRYRLLLTLGAQVNLSKLLLEMRGVNVSDVQPSLFDRGFSHD